MTAAIDIRAVTKIYNPGSNQAVKALDNVSLTIDDNEFFTLLGPSGCGKTTLLRLIAGFEQVSGGEIMLFDDEIENLEPNQRPVNTVFQHYALFPHMTVAQNVAFGLERLGKPRQEIEATVDRVLTLVKMKELGDRRPNQLSGGQQQRVALARALAPSPKVLLLDEPLSALDLKLRQAMREELKQLQKETGITFVFVTHDQEEALAMSDRIAVMSNGEVQQIGGPTNIYEHPVNRFVADFIGDTNFLDGEIVSINDDLVTCRIGAQSMFEAANSGGHKVGDRVTLFLRPEKISLSAPDRASEPGQRPGKVANIVYLGNQAAYTVDMGDGIELTAQARPREDGRLPFAIDDALAVGFSARALRVLAQ
ncbi:MAG: ABC transporter ATP-binding protein [Gammaproteobacteria bacterium]|nr:ABC transporter ATP-binding protein [Gammaproteobacteria bacterium]MDH3450299.1 ABC transporter ATP-binding protein [Gammaproteobacteria bacterium]